MNQSHLELPHVVEGLSLGDDRQSGARLEVRGGLSIQHCLLGFVEPRSEVLQSDQLQQYLHVETLASDDERKFDLWVHSHSKVQIDDGHFR